MSTTRTRDCRVCGGEGWTDGSAAVRRDGRTGDTTCVACAGTGKEPMPVQHLTFDPAAPSDGSCEGYVNDAGCRYHVSKRDPRDGALYCDRHAQSIDLHGVNGLNIKER